MNQPECDHYWIPTTTAAGELDFRMYHGKERVHATCSKCNARLWFTREEWRSIPAVEAPPVENVA